MKKFLAVYTGTAEAIDKWKAMSEQELKKRQAAGVKAWQEWAEHNEASIIEMGGPLGKTKRVSAAGVNNTHNNLTAYTIVKAKTHEAAANLFVGHPHFTIFPGDAVEIMECMDIPEM